MLLKMEFLKNLFSSLFSSVKIEWPLKNGKMELSSFLLNKTMKREDSNLPNSSFSLSSEYVIVFSSLVGLQSSERRKKSSIKREYQKREYQKREYQKRERDGILEKE